MGREWSHTITIYQIGRVVISEEKGYCNICAMATGDILGEKFNFTAARPAIPPRSGMRRLGVGRGRGAFAATRKVPFFRRDPSPGEIKLAGLLLSEPDRRGDASGLFDAHFVSIF